MRDHWGNCIAHFDNEVDEFISDYFGETARHCLLVAAAGFDPRSKRIAERLSRILGSRLEALFIREERRHADSALISASKNNEGALRTMIPTCDVKSIDVFADDEAAVGGLRIAELLDSHPIPDHITDVVLDLSALSIGIGFPAAKVLLENSESIQGRSFHLMIVSSPKLDDVILAEPADRPMAVKGFSGTGHLSHLEDVSRIWVPQLSKGKGQALATIGAALGDCYKICPMLPFPSRDPRRVDLLLGEYEPRLVGEWDVDPRDLVYVSEHNPLDCFRTLSALKTRYDRTVEGIFESHMILSPIGSKVTAAGALMVAIEHGVTVQYLETVRYDFDPAQVDYESLAEITAHILLSGPAYYD